MRRHEFLAAVMFLACTLAMAGNGTSGAHVSIPSLDELLETRVSSAARRDQAPSEAPSMVRVITSREIRRYGWTNLGEALGSLPGLHTTYDRSYTYLGVRGFGRPGDFTSRVLVMVDGHPLNDGIYDQAPIGSEFPLDMSVVDYIEYVPGAGSVMYGGNALFAVINVVTRSGAGMGQQLSVGAGQAGAWQAGGLAGWRGEESGDGLLYYGRERARGRDLYFESYRNGTANAWSRGLDHEANERLFAQYRRGGMSAALLASERVKGLPGGPFGIDLNHPGSHVWDSRWQGNLRFEHQLSPTSVLRMSAQAMEVRYQGEWVYSGTAQGDGMLARGLGMEASLTASPWPGHTIIGGMALRHDMERRQFNASLNVNTPRRALGVFLQDDVEITASSILSLGLRADEVRGNKTYRHLSPRFALIHRASPATVIKAIAGSAFRPPNAFETDYAFSGTNRANPELTSERSHTGELGIMHDLSAGASISGSLYATTVRDLITVERDPGSNLQQHHNVGTVNVRGLEIDSSWRFGAVTLRGSAAWQSVRHDSGAEVANAPRQLVKFLLDAPLAGNVRLAWETQYTGSRTADSGVIRRSGSHVGGHVVSHLTLTGGRPRQIEWRLKLRNVFDREYGNVAGTEYSSNFPGVQLSPMPLVLQDRRTISGDLRWHF